MADGRHLDKSKKDHVYGAVWPFGTKFCTMTHTEWYQHFQLLIIQDGRQPPFWKQVNRYRYISVTVQPIATKFVMKIETDPIYPIGHWTSNFYFKFQKPPYKKRLAAHRDDSGPLNITLQRHTLHLLFYIIKPQKLWPDPGVIYHACISTCCINQHTFQMPSFTDSKDIIG